MSFNINGTNIATIFDKTYPGNQTTGFTINGVDIGTIYTPATNGFTTETVTGYTNNGSDLNTLLSSSTPIPTVTINNAQSNVKWFGNPDIYLSTFGGTNGSFSIYVPFDNMDVSTLDILLVGGGGSGGTMYNWYEGAGGGGGGGVLTSTIDSSTFNTAGTYTFTIYCGEGGASVTGNSPGNPGNSSYIQLNNTTIMTVYGGGGGGGRSTNSVNNNYLSPTGIGTSWPDIIYYNYYGSLTVDEAQGGIASLNGQYASSGGVMNGYTGIGQLSFTAYYQPSVANSAGPVGKIGEFASGYSGTLYGNQGGMSYVAGGGGGGGGAGKPGAGTQIASDSFTMTIYGFIVTGMNYWGISDYGSGGTNANGGNGGDGYMYITGQYYGGGGGGYDTIAPGGTVGSGGRGGGGGGGPNQTGDGTEMTGGGGSAGFGQLAEYSSSGAGGSGVCLIAFNYPSKWNFIIN